MKAKIYKYHHNDKTYYAEGYDEKDIRNSLESHLNLKDNTLEEGKSPDFKNELKLIWDKSNTTHKLTLNKYNTTPKKKIRLHKQKSQCLHDLDRLLREDVKFLEENYNDEVISNKNNHIIYINTKDITFDNKEVGYTIFHSINGDKDISKAYRFPSLADAYKYVRSQLVKLDLADKLYKKTQLTNLEMCDSFIAGFGSGEVLLRHESDGVTVLSKTEPQLYNLEDFKI